jgi:hypothetical protein
MISEKHFLPFICLIFMLPRALNSVLVMAGSLKRCNSSLNEDVVLIRALRDSNLPKFLAEDSDIFQVRIFSNLAQINNIDLGKMAYVVFTNCVWNIIFECHVLFLIFCVYIFVITRSFMYNYYQLHTVSLCSFIFQH